MQGLVTLDFGNTHPHAGLFHKLNGKWTLIRVVPFDELGSQLRSLEMNPHNTSIVLCEVKSREDEIQKLIEEGYLLTRVKDYWKGSKFSGMPVNYTKSLGEDRLIEAFFSYKKYKIPTLIIDAGTFVTMDVVSRTGFNGGYIIPGSKIYFETFRHGEQLRDVQWALTPDEELPSNTSEAIGAGYTAFVALAQNIVKTHTIEKILLTGGDMNNWRDFFQLIGMGDIVEEHPHLLHWGLHYWMTTQIEQL